MDNATELCKIAYKYGSDKCPQLLFHNYTPFYWKLLKSRKKSIKKVLELGIGYPADMTHVVDLRGSYMRGASLYMWRDFFPNAQIYGADIAPETIFEEERIKTYLCDERRREDLVKLIEKTGPDIDLFIDDASHYLEDQVFTCQTLMTLLKKDVIYIIEDVRPFERLMQALNMYECSVPEFSRLRGDDYLVIVKNR